VETLLLAILVGLALCAVRMRDLLGATAVLGAYSLVMAMLWATMNALDVGFTEAAVGAGISTVLMLAALDRVGRRERGAGFGPVLKPALRSMAERNRMQQEGGDRAWWGARLVPLIVCLGVGAVLVYGAKDMPRVGDPDSPANSNPDVARRYLEMSADHDGEYGEVGPANMVTSVLGDYRGYDTMGETCVIFTAALCVLLLLREGRRKEGDHADG
jgi:multicomponent Na+:H+ antiporter subunit B